MVNNSYIKCKESPPLGRSLTLHVPEHSINQRMSILEPANDWMFSHRGHKLFGMLFVFNDAGVYIALINST